MSTPAADVAVDVMDTKADATDMTESAAEVATVMTDAVADATNVNEDGSCHTELEYGGFSKEIPPAFITVC